MSKILTIIGPTSVGKTAVSITVALRLSGEIISADSRQIYEYLTIGTAKPTDLERQQVPFHLIDFVDPEENYSCGQFARDAEKIIEEIYARNKVPIVCGGTGLYIRALFHPLHSLPESDPTIKKRLYSLLKAEGIDTLYQRLQSLDPSWAARISAHDTQRIIRGLEVHEMTGQTLSSFLQKRKHTSKFLPYYIGLTKKRDALYQSINDRYDRMIAEGLIEEVSSLLNKGYSPNSSALRTVGYKEIIAFLQGHDSQEQAIEKAKRHTRNLAKRQLTWFRKLPNVHWFDADEQPPVDKIAMEWEKRK